MDEKTSEKIKEFIRNECYYLINIREQVCELRNEIERRTRENDDLYYTLADTIGLYREYRVQYQSEFSINPSFISFLQCVIYLVMTISEYLLRF